MVAILLGIRVLLPIFQPFGLESRTNEIVMAQTIDPQIERQVRTNLRNLNIADPTAAKGSSAFRAVVNMGPAAYPVLRKIVIDQSVPPDPLKWAAFLIGVVAPPEKYDEAKRFLESVSRDPSYAWYVQTEARNGLRALEERRRRRGQLEIEPESRQANVLMPGGTPQDQRETSPEITVAGSPLGQGNVGGIDLSILDPQIKRDEKGIPLPLSQQPLGNMNIEGILPLIIHIELMPVPLPLGYGGLTRGESSTTQPYQQSSSLLCLSLANFRICRRKSLSDRKNRFSIPQNCFLDENYLKIRPKSPKKCQTQVLWLSDPKKYFQAKSNSHNFNRWWPSIQAPMGSTSGKGIIQHTLIFDSRTMIRCCPAASPAAASEHSNSGDRAGHFL